MGAFWEDLDNLSPVIGEFIADKNVQNCEVCGISDWTIYISDNIHVASIQYRHGSGKLVDGYTAVILSCLNCGNARMISTDVVEKWIDRKNQNKSED